MIQKLTFYKLVIAPCKHLNLDALALDEQQTELDAMLKTYCHQLVSQQLAELLVKK